MAAISCALSLDDIAPFPCATDGTCPYGFTCGPKNECLSNATCSNQCAAPEVCCAGTCVSLQTAVANCGACGHACSIPNASQSCVQGQCRGKSCKAGFADCNGDLSQEGGDGCEVTLATDSNNCGACGTKCPSNEVCNAGTCGCSTPPGGGNCVVFPECNCTPNENCTRGEGTSPLPEHCVPAGQQAPYSNCTADTQCPVGYLCIAQLCSQLCGQTTDCNTSADPGTWACLKVFNNSTYLGYGICSPHCNPLKPTVADSLHTPCPSNAPWCNPASNDQGATFCVGGPVGTKGIGAACSSFNECLAGEICPTATNQCTRLCTKNADCPASLPKCYFNTVWYDYQTHLGYCGA